MMDGGTYLHEVPACRFGTASGSPLHRNYDPVQYMFRPFSTDCALAWGTQPTQRDMKTRVSLRVAAQKES